MFTGLIEKKGLINSLEKNEDGMIMSIVHDKDLFTNVNDSISCNGVCLTATNVTKKSFSVQLVHETMDRTTAGSWKVGDHINLERALLATSRLGGHFVQGHVDCVTSVKNIEYFDKSSSWSFKMDGLISKYIVEKGSIALNGVSLTVARKSIKSFDVAIIPHTTELTTFGNLSIGDNLNVEVDILGKYIENFMEIRNEV
mgnify:FL=1